MDKTKDDEKVFATTKSQFSNDELEVVVESIDNEMTSKEKQLMEELVIIQDCQQMAKSFRQTFVDCIVDSKLNDMESSFEKKNKQLNEVMANNEELKSKFQLLTTTTDQMNQMIDTMDAELQGFRDNNIDINVYQQLIENHQKETNELNNKLTYFSNELDSMTKKYEMATHKTEQIMANNQQLVAKITEQHYKLQESKSRGQSIDKLIKDLEKEMEEYSVFNETKLKELNTNLEEKVNKLTAIITENQELNTKVMELNATNEQMKDINEVLNKKLNEEKEKLINTDKECEQLKDNLQKVNDKLVAANDTIESMNDKIRVLTNRAKVINTKYNWKCNEMDQIKTTNEQLMYQIHEQEVKWREDTDQLITDNKQLMDKISEQQIQLQEIVSLKAQLNQLSNNSNKNRPKNYLTKESRKLVKLDTNLNEINTEKKSKLAVVVFENEKQKSKVSESISMNVLTDKKITIKVLYNGKRYLIKSYDTELVLSLKRCIGNREGIEATDVSVYFQNKLLTEEYDCLTLTDCNIIDGSLIWSARTCN
ncbi:putative leucine-rich repeat-containing protein DDB_G0290503 [Oppia nitens]|uniref:putative leucine-rich repeat-containing protein DDB_G0290503 n=1 Tax=Oppia nitens TaxID=1686743 RepID=UPI0023DCB542|nr:putative leucine-rich repeat-containing protein DDB_G0290503 [Oppia nitens]